MKLAKLSLATIMALGVSASAADSLEGMFKEGKVSGEIRSMYINNDDSDDTTKNGSFAVGGNLKFETASFMGVSFGAGFYTTNDLGFNSAPNAQVGSLVSDADKSYNLLGEAYIQYKLGNTVVKAGRQQLDTPFAGPDDVRIVPDLFEAYTLINTDIADTTLVLAHVTKMAGWDSLAANNNMTEFQSMSEAGGVAGLTGSQDGVTVAAAVYSGLKDATLQAWYYTLAGDLDAIYLQADYSWNCLLANSIKMNGAVQYMDYSGDDKLSIIDHNVWGAKLDGNFGNSGFAFDLAYNKYSDDPMPGGAGPAAAWGGYPEFAYAEEVWVQSAGQDSDVFRIGGSYDFAKTGVEGLTAEVAYVDFSNMGANDIEVVDFILSYDVQSVANLSTRFVYEDRDIQAGDDTDILKLYVGYTF